MKKLNDQGERMKKQMKKYAGIKKILASLVILIVLSLFAITNCAGCSKRDKKKLIALFSFIKK